MKQLIIESTDKNDTITDMEETLEKALSSIKLQRENKQFSDVFLKDQKDRADNIVSKVFDNMVTEISNILKENWGES